MCLPIQRDYRSRSLFTLGLLCLVLSLASQSFDITFGQAPGALHFLRGFLLGVSLVFLLTSAWRMRQQGAVR